MSLWMLLIIYIAGLQKIKDRTLTNEEIMNEVNWQPISYIYKKRLLTYMHTIYYGNCPALLSRPFEKRKTRTQNTLQFDTNPLKRDIGTNSLRYRGSLLWNATNSSFKKKENTH